MDQAFLVGRGQKLLKLLDRTKAMTRAAMWVHFDDSDIWKLWIVPSTSVTDKREFYRIVADTIAENSLELDGLDVSSTEYVRGDHPAMESLSHLFHIPSTGQAHLSGTTLNGFFLPEGIVLRMALAETVD